MLKFEKLEECSPNQDLLNYFKGKVEVITNGSVNGILNTNLKTIMPTVYKVTIKAKSFEIYEYNGDFKNDKNFYVPAFDNTYYFNELKQIFKEM